MLKKLLIVLPVIIFILWLYENSSSDETLIQHPPSKLETVGAKCLDLSERSVASLTPSIEYQKLELISRQSYTLFLCMTDRGFIENPTWRKVAEQRAVGIAQQQKISISEAVETMRRKDMAIFSEQNKQPSYWIVKK